MRTDADHRVTPPIPEGSGRPPTSEPVDLDDPEAVRWAIAQHQAGTAVFAVPFHSKGQGTLTWLDPRGHEGTGGASDRAS